SVQERTADLVQFLTAGEYTLTVTDRSGVAGSFRLQTNFLPSSLPGERIFNDLHVGSVAVADVDGDGRPGPLPPGGLFHSTFGGAGALKAGGGAFRPAPDLFPGRSVPALAVADVDGDGRPDLLAADPNGGVGVALNSGGGAFRPAPDLFPGRPVSALAV